MQDNDLQINFEVLTYQRNVKASASEVSGYEDLHLRRFEPGEGSQTLLLCEHGVDTDRLHS